jgi:DNA-binding transcriptional LysR family regulator
MVDLFFIKTFVTAAKTSSFRVAADQNFVTQPAVSQHIRILERKLDTTLFERQGRKVCLTPAGKTFLPYAENILKQYEEAKMRIKESENKFKGTIRIATIYSVGLYELQPTIKIFFKKYPDINLHIEYQHNASIYEMVLNKVIDFGLVAFPQQKNGIVAQTFLEDKLVLVQSPMHQIVKKRRLLLKDLGGLAFIAFSALIPTGRSISRFLSIHNIHPNVIHEYDNIELIKSAVILGMGCALVPQNTIARELREKSLEIIGVDGLNLKRPLGILYPEGKVFTKSTRAFCEIMLKRKRINSPNGKNARMSLEENHPCPPP